MKWQKNLRFIIISLLCYWCTGVLQAQYLPMNIPVTKQGRTLEHPWAGGFDAPQFSSLDLNKDGLDDLVVFDRFTEVSTTFLNRGTPGQVDYEFAPSYHSLLPQRNNRSFLLARDFNGDGIGDLFGIQEVFGLGLRLSVWKGYRNADDSIRFNLEVNKLTYDDSPRGASRYEELFVYRTDVPGIGDVDGDGDLDIFSFPNSFEFPTNITYYENKAADNGNLDSLQFYLGSECWGLMSEELDSAKVRFGPSPDSCYNNTYFNDLTRTPYQLQQSVRNAKSGRNPRHIGTNITLVDHDGDNNMDAVLSEIDFQNANLLSGTTVNDTLWMLNQQPQFPIYDKPIDIYSFPSVYFLDVNNDGVDDMLASPSDLSDGRAVNDSVVWYYQNTGTNSSMAFNFQQKDFLVGDMIDVGRKAHPVVVDVTGEGIQDLLIGGFGRCLDNGQYDYGITLLRNSGTATQPSFDWVTNDFAGTDSLGEHNLYPTFGDLDGDGDQDMICGNENGTLIYFENNAGSNQSITFNAPVRNYANINVFSRSAPQLVDLDRDGDLDLVLGSSSGRIYYYQNGGSVLAPNFASVPTTTNLGGYIGAFPNTRSSMPYFYDNQGNYELIIGQERGYFLHLDSIENNVLGNYTTRSQDYKGLYRGQYAQMAITDINSDGKMECLLGTGGGGVMFMNEVDSFISTTKVAELEDKIRIYPNPAQDLVTIDCQMVIENGLTIVVYNALGQPLLQQQWQEGHAQQQLSLKGLPTGLLWIELQGETFQKTLRLVKQ
ncbi:MAG: T9SS type A sorting domain-containing protein [Aureispira sp.]